MELKNWHGVVDGVKFLSRGPMSDPQLIWGGHKFNYWDISEVMHEEFKTDMAENSAAVGTSFEEWLENNQDRVTGYLGDVVAGGYFG